ncbi:hypothetical protein PCASD_12416 [Puccinia coronata f. sp. avenae]|uniref:Uncharacterized protein n=1 Tax=Puccinia coronata f. sp. avenae TaxID=200324 RepID=A0A2N5U4Q3_9BASI|nr:hypothetical protein PCASD_15853 [Puccinia coronata f. sp. avenae]PLW32745.1 hypothetical protein PCASD_12416 [Puccinia coronata f. sp. avenae]
MAQPGINRSGPELHDIFQSQPAVITSQCADSDVLVVQSPAPLQPRPHSGHISTLTSPPDGLEESRWNYGWGPTV